MSQPFKWKVVVFDDDPQSDEVSSALRLYLDLGFICEVCGQANDRLEQFGFLRNENDYWNRLKQAHLFLVDVQWLTIVKNDVAITLPHLPKCERLNQIGKGIQAVGDAFDKLDISLGAELLLSPNVIPNDVRGYWIAAALSYINPGARILFFSGYEALIQDPKSAVFAFLQFKTRPVDVMHKHNATDTDKVANPLFDNLIGLQMFALNHSEEAYGWFVSSVVLPTLLNAEPEKGECGPLFPTDESTQDWQLGVEGFFPQWSYWKQTNQLLDELKKFLALRPFRLSSNQRRALESTKHDLRSALSSGLEGSSLLAAETSAYAIGQTGGLLVSTIVEARKSRSTELVERALTICDKISENSLTQLWDLCREIKEEYGARESVYECDPTLERKPQPTVHSDEEDYDSQLPFDIEYFRRILGALKHNATKVRNLPLGQKTLVSLRVQESLRELVITYQDNTIGFPTLGNLADAVSQSLKKPKGGINRGLPMALAFGLHFPLSRLEVKWNDGTWFELFPGRQTTSDVESRGGFGIRWTFLSQGYGA
jgi:hypothetical protein